MNWQRSFRLFSTMAMTSLIVAPAAFSLSLPQRDINPQSNPLLSLEFPPSSDRGAPRTGGGGTRSGNTCIATDTTPLTALMPNPNNVGKTIQNTPTLYWYVPETTATLGEFVLIDEDANEVYFESFELPETPGIVKLTLPEQTQLKVGRNYVWYFTLVCNRLDRSRDRYVIGELERTELSQSVKREINRLSPLQQAEVYAEYQLWHETLSLVEQQRLAQPQQWQELLTSVGLETFAEEEVQALTITEESSSSLTDIE